MGLPIWQRYVKPWYWLKVSSFLQECARLFLISRPFFHDRHFNEYLAGFYALRLMSCPLTIVVYFGSEKEDDEEAGEDGAEKKKRKRKRNKRGRGGRDGAKEQQVNYGIYLPYML